MDRPTIIPQPFDDEIERIGSMLAYCGEAVLYDEHFGLSEHPGQIQAQLALHDDPNDRGGMAPQCERILGPGWHNPDMEKRGDRVQPICQGEDFSRERLRQV